MAGQFKSRIGLHLDTTSIKWGPVSKLKSNINGVMRENGPVAETVGPEVASAPRSAVDGKTH